MDTQTIVERARPRRESRLILEDSSGITTYLPRFLAQKEGEYFPILRESGLLEETPARGQDTFSWDGQSSKLQKIFLAKEMMKDLNIWYEYIFREDYRFDEGNLPGKQLFFNTNLIHFIAATDDSEDTLGHSQFVASYTLMLARELGLEDKRFLIDIERGALLHDIGKIGIPDSILRKKGPLTNGEREIIKDHPLLGYELIKDFPFLQKASQVVLFHHERYDGRGYPYGLAGEEIPLEARIFSLADTVDAITSDRPYRKGQSFQVARREVERNCGGQFDPLLVDVFLSIPAERWHKAKIETLRSLRLPSIH